MSKLKLMRDYVKTTEEMLEYAKSIVDNCQHSVVLFLVKEYNDISACKHLFTKPSHSIYKSKGKLYIEHLPRDYRATHGMFGGMDLTHIFVCSFPTYEVSNLLKSRIKLRATKEPCGFYLPTHVERWEDY
jgi:hypothetical protein